MIESTFYEIAAVLALATLLGIAGQRLKQPLIIMFLVAGILGGPAGLQIIRSHGEIELLANIGIALLLFIVGLKLDIHLIRSTGPVALATGLGQIFFTSAIGFGMALAFKMTTLNAAYVAVALTFSSTIIIVKLLSDKREIDSLHGQIAIGFLIVQDIAAILALITLTSLGAQAHEGGGLNLMTSLRLAVKGVGLLGGVFLISKYVMPWLLGRMAYSLELLTLFSIGWAVALAAGSDALGFSKEVGAFLAGMSLASTEYRDTIGSRLTSLRDFLLLFFFIDLGARLDWSTVGAQLAPSAVFSVFVLIGNPLIVLAIMGIMGYRRRTGFLAGLTVAQISEFSLIVAALGLSLGHITPETMGLITLVGVVTICCSTYMILYSGALYRILATPLKIFERRDPFREAAMDSSEPAPATEALIVGLGNYGGALAERLLVMGKTLVGVDFDPELLKRWSCREMCLIYGDIGDHELHEHLPLDQVDWVVCTVRSRELNLTLLKMLKIRGYKGKIALVAVNRKEAEEFERAGAHLVFRPYTDAAEHAADALTYSMDFLPRDVNWPIAFRNIRVPAASSMAGRAIKDIPLRSATTATILGVSRAGRLNYDPGPDFTVYAGDHLLIVGPPEEMMAAEAVFSRIELPADDEEEIDRFELAEIPVAEESPLADRTVGQLRFRQEYGASIVGIRRGDEQIVSVEPSETILGGDVLIVIGVYESVENLKASAPL